jgi:murein DD-endopeptidase MepM/ murein hydrolase activator NlpD
MDGGDCVNGRSALAILLLALLAGGTVFAMRRWDADPPVITGPESLLLGRKARELAFEIEDGGSGIRSIRVVLEHAAGEETLFNEDYPGSAITGAARGTAPVNVKVTMDPGKLPRALQEGFLRVTVRDWSWWETLRGNQARLDVPVTIDLTPPRVAIATGLTYVKRGGSGVVVYTPSEATVRDGVRVGKSFFPGHPWGERRVAFYAVPTDAEKNPKVRLEAEDAAGNVYSARWPVVVKEREMPEASVTLPASFLETKVVELAATEGIDTRDPVRAFNRINSEVRAANEERVREALADTAENKLWDGQFLQLPNSEVTSRFAERRTYFVAGKPVSKATHFGYDLASTAAAPITAAAAGRVVFADELGIYGNCVLVDHGLGVGSLYGHLSRVDVAPGDQIARGEPLGLSGATGLAGGDHLHFAILVGGSYVDPLEWWDPKWLRENVEARLER